MAEKQAKMTRIDNEDGSHTFRFAHGAEIRVAVADFPENVQHFYADFGLVTKVRNFTAIEKGEDGATATPEQMYEKMSKGVEMLKQGILRIAAEPGEKRAGGTLLLEAAMEYKRRKAAAKGETFTATELEVAKELEALSEEQLTALKATALFKAAMEAAKLARQTKRAAEAEAAAAKEAENAPM